jgi:hypothetical protein
MFVGEAKLLAQPRIATQLVALRHSAMLSSTALKCCQFGIGHVKCGVAWLETTWQFLEQQLSSLLMTRQAGQASISWASTSNGHAFVLPSLAPFGKLDAAEGTRLGISPLPEEPQSWLPTLFVEPFAGTGNAPFLTLVSKTWALIFATTSGVGWMPLLPQKLLPSNGLALRFSAISEVSFPTRAWTLSWMLLLRSLCLSRLQALVLVVLVS